jgi:hypothetical protein
LPAKGLRIEIYKSGWIPIWHLEVHYWVHIVLLVFLKLFLSVFLYKLFLVR